MQGLHQTGDDLMIAGSKRCTEGNQQMDKPFDTLQICHGEKLYYFFFEFQSNQIISLLFIQINIIQLPGMAEHTIHTSP